MLIDLSSNGLIKGWMKRKVKKYREMMIVIHQQNIISSLFVQPGRCGWSAFALISFLPCLQLLLCQSRLVP